MPIHTISSTMLVSTLHISSINTNCKRNMTIFTRNGSSSFHDGFFFFFFFFFFFIALFIITTTPTCTGQTTNFSRFVCNADNISPDPPSFLINFNAIHADLRANLSSPAATGFATAQIVRTTAPIYAIFHCRGYTSHPRCPACLDVVFAISNARCYAKHRATVFTDECYLSYSTINLFVGGGLINLGQSGFCDDPTSGEGRVGLDEPASEALEEVAREVVGREGRFAAGKKGGASGGGRTVYAAGECLPVLRSEDCRRCLESALGNVKGCLPTAGGRAVESGCFMRLSGEEFFDASLAVDLDLTRDIVRGRSGGKTIIAGVIVGAVGGICILLLIILYYIRRSHKINEWTFTADIEGQAGLEALVSFTFDDLKAATRNFSEENKLGQGGFSSVYKGVLKNGKVVAIKLLSISGTTQARTDFESEVILISNIHHRNLLSLLGCCRKGEDLLLVYELMEKGSLDRYIFDNKRETLDWKKMFNIILGSARGIAYLHEEFHHCIIHRDIKPGNILLDNEYQPKVADFGLARLLPEDKTHVKTKFAGTLGYTAPEYFLKGTLSEKVDVYSFGIVLLEVLSGKRCTVTNPEWEDKYLLHWAWALHEKDKLIDVVDKSILTEEVEEEVKKVAEIGLMCTQSSSKRPSMFDVVALLLSKDHPKLALTRPNFIANSSQESHSSDHDRPATNATMLVSYFSGR